MRRRGRPAARPRADWASRSARWSAAWRSPDSRSDAAFTRRSRCSAQSGLDRRQARLRDGDRRDQPEQGHSESRAAASREAESAPPGSRRRRARRPAPRAATAGAATPPRPPRPPPSTTTTTADDDSSRTPLADEGDDPGRDRRAAARAPDADRAGRHDRAARSAPAAGLRHDHRRAARRRPLRRVHRTARPHRRVRRARRLPAFPRRRRAAPPDVAPCHERTYRVLGGGGRRPRVRDPHRAGERGAPRGAQHHPHRARPRFRWWTSSASISARCSISPARRSRAASSTPRSCSTSPPTLVRMDLALDFALTPKMLARYRPGHSRRLPEGSPGLGGLSQPRLRPKGGGPV